MAAAPTNNLTAGSGLLATAAAQAPAATATGPAPRPGAPTPAPAPGGVPVTPTPSLTSLYAQNPGAGTFAASNTGTAAPVGAAPTANASKVGPLAAINSNGTINPNDSTNAASQLDAITRANSPYIQQATQQGLLTAASRGLENSSLGAGAAEAAAVQAAAPLAEQNANEATGGQMQNSQLETQAGEFNASQLNANQQLEAQLKTQQTQFNASQQQQAAATNAAAKNAMTQQTMQLNEQINQQYLSGSQSQTLASIQGQFNELIQSNASAAGLYTSMQNQIGAVMANKDIAPQRVADTISAMQSLTASGLSIIDAINGGSPPVIKMGTNTPATAPRSAAGTTTPMPAPAPIGPPMGIGPVGGSTIGHI
jgi:hypothetical protein